MKRLIAMTLLMASTGAMAKDTTPPPRPATDPNWVEVREVAEGLLKANLADPMSAQIVWEGGWQWSSIKRDMVSSRQYGWLGCAQMNAKNRLGGYVGFERYYVLIRADGKKFLGYSTMDAHTQCRDAKQVTLQAAFEDKAEATAPVDVADELSKLAGLRDKGILSEGEFQARKTKLLSR